MPYLPGRLVIGIRMPAALFILFPPNVGDCDRNNGFGDGVCIDCDNDCVGLIDGD